MMETIKTKNITFLHVVSNLSLRGAALVHVVTMKTTKPRREALSSDVVGNLAAKMRPLSVAATISGSCVL